MSVLRPAEVPAGQKPTRNHSFRAAVAAVTEIPAKIFTVPQFLDVPRLHLGPTACTQEVLQSHDLTASVGRLNGEDDLEARRGPAQGSSHPGPQSDLLCQAAAAHRHISSTWQLLQRAAEALPSTPRLMGRKPAPPEPQHQLLGQPLCIWERLSRCQRRVDST